MKKKRISPGGEKTQPVNKRHDMLHESPPFYLGSPANRSNPKKNVEQHLMVLNTW